MLLRWIVRLEKAALTAVLLSYITSYSIQQQQQQQQHPILVAASTSFATESIMENGATTISQECLPRRQRKIDVTEVFIVCDHQNNNNDGEDDRSEDGGDDVFNTNKPACRTGDLAKVAIGFTVSNNLPSNSTIFVSMKTHYYGRRATIRNRTDVCNFANFGYINDGDGSFYSPNNYDDDNDNGDENSGDGGDDDEADSGRVNSLCPIQTSVHYMLFASFTIQESSSSRKSNWQEFKPDLSASFYLSTDESSPPIGCVLTGTKAKHAMAQRRSRNGVIALIVSISSFVTVFALCLLNQKQRRQAVELLENNRVASMIRRYNYRRGNNSGSSSGLMMDSSVRRRSSEDDLYNRNDDDNSSNNRDFSFDHTNQQPVAPPNPPPPWANQHL